MSGMCGVVVSNPDRGVELNRADLFPMLGALDGPRRTDSAFVHVDLCSMGVQKSHDGLAGVERAGLPTQNVALAFEGSLYNLGELLPGRREGTGALMGIVQLYLKEGLTFVDKLRGDFSLAIWDGREAALYLATDRFRVYPLFYYQDDDKLVFASRIAGILACPLFVKRTINLESLVDVVASSIIPTPKTVFHEIKKMPPGHVLTYRKGAARLTPYWEINFRRTDHSNRADLTRRLRAHMTHSVSIRLATDGASDRIGSFLSGGVDSSTVTGLMTQLAGRPIRSFSIGFEEERFNEMEYSRIAARAFGAEHHEYLVTARDAYDAIPVLLNAFDEPFANASAIPTYFCAKIAKDHGVDVLYAGDGGDELFAGNERYATQRLFEYYGMIAGPVREGVVRPLVYALAALTRSERIGRVKKYIQRASIPYPDRLFSYGFFKIMPMVALFEDDVLDVIGREYDPYAPIADLYSKAPAETDLDRQLYIDLKLAISDNDLLKVTRMAEAAGVTVRFPFLDHHLAEFAAGIPASIKMKRRQLRSFFKEAYADLLPLETRKKRKHGFGLPIPIWLRTHKGFNEMMRDLVMSPRSLRRGYFRRAVLEELITRHKTDETSFYGAVLWNLMVLELWHRKYVDEGPATGVPGR